LKPTPQLFRLMQDIFAYALGIGTVLLVESYFRSQKKSA